MERPVAGLAARGKVPKATSIVHGRVSLQPSYSGSTPLLEAHPGSPVDLSGGRHFLAASSSARQSPGSPKLRGGVEEDIRRDDVAAKENTSVGNRDENEMKPPQRRIQTAAAQPFYIPAKVPEETPTTTVSGDDSTSVDAVIDSSLRNLHFETDNGVWISAHPVAHESRTGLATSAAAGTLTDDRFSHGRLTIDTSVASSGNSMISSPAASPQSANSSDPYGWEEELDRQTSIEGHNELERLPSSGATIGPPAPSGVDEHQQHKRGDGKRKSLLFRVLSLSGRRDSEDSSSSSSPPSAECPTTSV
jgi:hypothetical protein